MRAMILAAGYGTRFRPVTRTLPKPMIPVLNRPLLGWVVESCLGSGFREIIINLHHLPGPIRSYLDAEFRERASIELSEEDEILGTGGALRRVGHLLTDEFVLVNGDTIQWPPFDDLVETRQSRDALACLLLRHVPPGDSFTPVWFDDGWITGFETGRGESFMFAGAHALSSEILDLLPDRDVSALTTEVYVPIVEGSERRLAGFVRDDDWFDVGTSVRYMQATRQLLEGIRAGRIRPPAGNELLDGGTLCHQSAGVEGEVESCSIGAGSRIRAGCRLAGSVLWNDVTVGPSSSVAESILAHGVSLPSGSVLENALVVEAHDGEDDDGEVARAGDWLVRPVDRSRPWTFQTG